MLKRTLRTAFGLLSISFHSKRETQISELNTYDNKEIATIVVAKTRNFISNLKQNGTTQVNFSQLKPLLGIFPLLGNQALSVIDLGGGAGYHYFLLNQIFKPKIEINWCVVETEVMIESAREFESEKLRFSSNLKDAYSILNQKCDLVLLSSALQYLPNPAEYLKQIFELRPNFIYLSRTPFTEGRAFEYMQQSKLADNGPGSLPDGYKDMDVSYKAKILARSEFEAMLPEYNYKIAISIIENDEAFTTSNSLVSTRGYLIQRA
jgi:putative methyltransferase (TIGR04325 family)